MKFRVYFPSLHRRNVTNLHNSRSLEIIRSTKARARSLSRPMRTRTKPSPRWRSELIGVDRPPSVYPRIVGEVPVARIQRRGGRGRHHDPHLRRLTWHDESTRCRRVSGGRRGELWSAKKARRRKGENKRSRERGTERERQTDRSREKSSSVSRAVMAESSWATPRGGEGNR